MQDIWETRVRFEETDAQAVVFYGNYVTYQDETVSQYLRDIDYGWGQQSTFDIHVVNVDVNYRKSATFGDELVCAARIEQIGDASLTFEWECRRKADDAVCADGTVTHVCVRDGEPTRFPDELREAAVAYQETPPSPV
ncbi:acyl-CoA thioesterase [Halosegnis longus]|uniref:Acyl-CoA thioesterase n=1 Tax=Halosegnis longus TaxID=2216012 RepID=A0AAJ4R7A4_9EURY|nr:MULTISPECIES: thioesterase family protein [Halobacteriales]RNJ25496.1 acyl-CoA thioesterase [Salella cibi]